jgi:PAT family beta-lactamase induction signal transducer AmpG
MSLLSQVFSTRMLIALAMGFSSGLPLLLTAGTLQAWMKESSVDLRTLGFYTALVGLPYAFKFVWAPIFDRYALPLGRRRGWLLLTQLMLTCAIFSLSLFDPKSQTALVAAAALAISFFSASQDAVVDAYRRESLQEEELGLGSAVYVAGYRTGMLVASGGALILADQHGFAAMYQLMALCMLVGITTTLLAVEPRAPASSPRNFGEAVTAPLVEYFTRDGAVITLAFIFLYKVGDILAGHITTPFYLELGFTKTEIGAIVKLWGFWATIAGSMLGGVLILRWGIPRSLFWFGVLQMLSTAGFVGLAQIGKSHAALATVVTFENFTAGLGTSAFLGFMAALTNRRFTATQYALLSSLMALPRTTVTAAAGAIQEQLGWTYFFVICTLVAIPGLVMARKASSWITAKKDSEPTSSKP